MYITSMCIIDVFYRDTVCSYERQLWRDTAAIRTRNQAEYAEH